MINTIKIPLLVATFILLNACGGNAGGNSTNESKSTTTIEMKIGVPTAIEAEYRIISDDDTAVIDILIIDSNKTATLMKGKASIEKPL